MKEQKEVKGCSNAKGLQGVVTNLASLGSIADKIIEAIKNDHLQPGVMTKEDLANYKAVERAPLNTTWNGEFFFFFFLLSWNLTALSRSLFRPFGLSFGLLAFRLFGFSAFRLLGF